MVRLSIIYLVPFIKTQYCWLLTLETIIFGIFPYPSLTLYFIQFELGNTVILPASSCLCALCVFRLFFMFKIFKGLTKWSSTQVENVCEKHGCKANSSFAFKVMQKEYPFFTLSSIFFLTCVCFGFALRIIEQHFWETQEQKTQDWSYEWNAVWCIFVSMTTVGYGDFYPRTHYGRIITLIACVIGIYFISMMTLFMTKQSILNESEYKAYKLITRLKLRKEIKQMQSKMVFHCLGMSKYKIKIAEGADNNKFEVKYSYERRCVISLIEKIKNKQRAIKTFEFMPTKEQLYDVCERVDNDIREIKNEIQNLELINNSIVNYVDSQIDVSKNIQKNIFATKLLYKLIKNNEIFDKLNNLDCDNLSLNDTPDSDEHEDDEESNTVHYKHPMEKIKTVKDLDSTNDQSIILNYDINPQEIKAHFSSLILNCTKKKKKEVSHTTMISD